jgi:hypothetical protein
VAHELVGIPEFRVDDLAVVHDDMATSWGQVHTDGLFLTSPKFFVPSLFFVSLINNPLAFL